MYKIDKLNGKVIPNCTLKHLNKKENVLILVANFKELILNDLYQVNHKEPNYNMLNFDKFNNSLERAYKELLAEIVQPYEKVDLIDITTRLNQLKQDVINIPLIFADLNKQLETVKTNAIKIYDLLD
jgi:hypothetical protein